MEDTHVADVGLPGGEDVALFAVFDGHGGQVRAGTLPLPARLDRPARPPLWLSSPGRVAGRGGSEQIRENKHAILDLVSEQSLAAPSY